MRPIKFRGIDIETGDFVYGEFGKAANTGESIIYFLDDENNWVGATVHEYSVAQLVGYDKENREVYEGDVIANSAHNGLTPCGEPLSAQLTPCLADKYGKTYFSGDLIRY